MVKKSKLLNALDAHKGRDFDKERQKKLQKAAEKKKRLRAERQKEENEVDNEEKVNGPEDSSNVNEEKQDTAAVTKKGDERKEDPKATRAETNASGDEGDSENEDEHDENDLDAEEADSDEDIPLSELSEDDRADVIPHQRLTINNSAAIRASLKRISFINESTPFSEHNSLTSTEQMDIPDPNDDLNRELAFYKVCVSAATNARSLLKKEGVPFSRPTDYFAEMVKSDEHMGKIKKKLFEEAAAKKASAEAKKQRELKKFGKQVQIAKLQQRQKEKRETLEKINSLKRKRKIDGGAPTEDEDLFDVALEDAGKSERKKQNPTGGPNPKRQKKNEKYGFGGKKRFAKSGDAMSSGDLKGFSVSKMKGKKPGGAAKRPGKSRRAAAKR
ncbi:Eukaryotic rRNA processing protein EBP2 containing protein [Coccidioides posadasii C735 delta SOWgp]|uniref:Eukaryotic rRNA processing protein EBP2 containing protein n=1 Tax=Coccidioides posadasii (strain C735) TaxID=222929 RepID=C5PD93_COCP7|nr:Eukaryotic rRNA processing protein EBP2 containing protein [Coccidioides posadasii C735 delta SOWgp]EER25054.1 Eukaryotic rRNA processing protein EBP2 containing protein [Coccidioides posadasii C735 delta SOWgp]|eukprot:XP_003067199.1 Eukaryotic rRNA processing protein EBP2 containing protein [Coccidioides posadasii C735 delta SOWgp]